MLNKYSHRIPYFPNGIDNPPHIFYKHHQVILSELLLDNFQGNPV